MGYRISSDGDLTPTSGLFTDAHTIRFDQDVGSDVSVQVWNQQNHRVAELTVPASGLAWTPGRGLGSGRFALKTSASTAYCDRYSMFVHEDRGVEPRWGAPVQPVPYRRNDPVGVKNETRARLAISVYDDNGDAFPQLFGWTANGVPIEANEVLLLRIDTDRGGRYRIAFVAGEGDDGSTNDGEIRVGSGDPGDDA